MRRAKIICTIGPASHDSDTLRTLVREGMDVARLNLSHGDADAHGQVVRRIRDAAVAEDRTVAILADLQGPKFRLGEIAAGGIKIADGAPVTLTTRAGSGQSPDSVPLQNANLPDLVTKGDSVLIDDGSIELRVLNTSVDAVECVAVVGGTVHSNKGINLPGISVRLPSLTEKDLADIDSAVSWGVDWIALSFVRDADDVTTLRNELASRDHGHMPVMAKIEKPRALDNIGEIIDVCDGVMVARGDLGIEIPAEKVPMAQKRVIERCNDAGVPVVTATQMLESMVENARPTRAEAADVANAVLDGTDAVMLSAETTIGRHPVAALRTMSRIVCQVETERGAAPDRAFRHLEEDCHLTVARSLAHAARGTASDLNAAAIVAITASGHTARIASRFRPGAPIIAVTPELEVQRRLRMYWGVEPLMAPRTDNTDEMIANALEAVRSHGLVEPGGLVVVLAGAADSKPGTTDLMRVQVL